MEYLRLFESHSDYESAQCDLMTPNVSHCINENEVHYNETAPKVIITFTLSESNTERVGIKSDDLSRLFGVQGTTIPVDTMENVSRLKIDGVEIDIENDLTIGNEINMGSTMTVDTYQYQFTAGEHTIEYCLMSPVIQKASFSCFGASSIQDMGPIPINTSKVSQCTVRLESVTEIDDAAFFNVTNMTDIQLPNTITRIGFSAFLSCHSLEEIVLPNIETIEMQSFVYCRSLTSVTIPNSVKTIESAAFVECPFTEITIPSSVTKIGYYDVDTMLGGCFSQCESLNKVIIEATTPPTLYGSSNFNYEQSGDGTSYPILVPPSSVDLYKAAPGWSEYSDRIQPNTPPRVDR